MIRCTMNLPITIYHAAEKIAEENDIEEKEVLKEFMRIGVIYYQEGEGKIIVRKEDGKEKEIFSGFCKEKKNSQN